MFSQVGRWVLSASLFLLLSSCASAGRLAEYDFRDRGLAVVSTLPPQPIVVVEDFDPDEGVGRGWWRALLHWGSEAVRDSQAQGAGEKLAEAAQTVDVSTLMGDEVLERAARLLRARAVPSVQDADFEVEVRVREYGIRAGTWDGQADYFVKGEVLLLDGETGLRIWKDDVDASDAISRRGWPSGGTVGNLLTARDLGNLSVEEIQGALAGLAEFAAVKMAERLEAGLEKAGLR